MPFLMPRQEQSLWCWAAVAVSVDHYFVPERTLRQCHVARRVLALDCCANHSPCNVAERLTTALTKIGREFTFVPNALPFPAVREEIDAGRPVCALIQWYGGGGHFVAIYGYDHSAAGHPLVHVADPLFADGLWYYASFCTAYQAGHDGLGPRGGQWVETYQLHT